MKTCTKCKIKKSKSEFYNSKKRKDGVNPWCKSCCNSHNKEYVQTPEGKEAMKRSVKNYTQKPKSKEIKRNSQLKRNYGITLEQYDNILEAQEHVCAICGTDVPDGPGRFQVDHNHTTGEIRGLLCTRCNTMLGYAKDNIEIFSKAIKYLSIVRG